MKSLTVKLLFLLVIKLIGEESGVVLKDNTNGGVGGATWAYEVARQTMVCPILVEDVHPSGQMLVEVKAQLISSFTILLPTLSAS